MRLVAIRSYPQGPRVWVLGQRVHHGATGCAILAAAAITRRRVRPLAVAGIALALHDRRDWRAWFAREILESAGCVTNRTELGVDGSGSDAVGSSNPTTQGGH